MPMLLLFFFVLSVGIYLFWCLIVFQLIEHLDLAVVFESSSWKSPGKVLQYHELMWLFPEIQNGAADPLC
jgi:hypothetical protein